MFLRRLFRHLRDTRFDYTPLVEVRIFKNHILGNLRVFEQESKKNVAPVLKSNAYGHGLISVAKILDQEKLPFFVVDSYHEALMLRNEGIRSKILVIGYSLPQNIARNKLTNVSFAMVDLKQLKEIASSLNKRVHFHLKVDTGMHRQGILPSEIQEAFAVIKSNKHIFLEGICSHLAQAEDDDSFTEHQISEWHHIINIARDTFPEIQYFHLGATGSFPKSAKIEANVMRLGIGLYGIKTKSTANLPLQGALELRSIISAEKKINPGETVGYSRTFKANQPSQIGIIPAGYFEGVDRRLSGQGFIKCNDLFFPICGRVSMNITTVLLPENKSFQGSTAVLIGANEQDKNSVANIAALCNTIPYEILVHIPERLRRITV